MSAVGDAGMAGMTQTLLLVVLFVAALAALPWLIRRLQQQRAGLQGRAGAGSRVLSAVAVGPQQRVVTVEVGPPQQRTLLVLGVTAQAVSCLHVLPAAAGDAASFASEMSAARAQAVRGAEGGHA